MPRAPPFWAVSPRTHSRYALHITTLSSIPHDIVLLSDNAVYTPKVPGQIARVTFSGKRTSRHEMALSRAREHTKVLPS